MRLILTLAAAALALTSVASAQHPRAAARTYLGFDSNEYPGDAMLPALHKHFAFTGFWLNNPPGANHNPWAGKRGILMKNGFGFLVVFNGRLDDEIVAAKRSGRTPAAFGRADAAAALAAAHREGFPPRTILFVDQEEGGRMLPEQAGYLLGWTEAVARSNYRVGVYASGQPVDDGKDDRGRPVTITTVQDLRHQIAAKRLHTVEFWIAQDACPPAPGCVARPNPPAPDVSGTVKAAAWQFAQSPRRKDITRACAATYSRDGNCYPPGNTSFTIDLSSATSPDPSHGR
jgi:Domain of unknown function (DUF1906)